MIPLAQGDPKNYTPEVRNVGFRFDELFVAIDPR
jgi:hypothetical protein